MAEAPASRPSSEPSGLEDLLLRTRRFLAGAARDCLRRPLDDLLRWALGRAAAYLAAAAVFLLLAGMNGLREAGVSPAASWAAAGAAAALGGLLILGAARGRPKRGD